MSNYIFSLTKRELFAAMALSGLKTSTPENTASLALEIADALVAALEADPTATAVMKAPEPKVRKKPASV